ncbi:hypothetical protein KY362_00110 [Candidatus Woesearchaeota archaeon]|nr:hypothetical protein [Candidatus Woesearchaeota archaeon]
MTRPLPKWIMQKYAVLWAGLKGKEFDHIQAARIVPENTSAVLSLLRKAGWLEARLDDSDSRKRLYRLKSPEQAVQDLVKKNEK